MNELRTDRKRPDFIPADNHVLPETGSVWAAFVNNDYREPFRVFASEFNATRFLKLTIGKRFTHVEIREVYND